CECPTLHAMAGDFQMGLVADSKLSPGDSAFSRESTVMESKRKRTERRSKSVLLPSEDTLTAERKQLPFFEPYETRELLADAARTNNGNASHAAIADVYDQHCRGQTVQLLRALGCDPNDEQFWAKAFMKLARLHHNVGRLVHRLRLPSNAKAWTMEDESILILGVYKLVQTGLSEREAVRIIADAEVFPYYERQASQRPSGQASRVARRLALWRKYQRLRKQSRGPDPIARQLGIGVTDFEMFLTGIGLPAPSAASSADKPRARK